MKYYKYFTIIIIVVWLFTMSINELWYLFKNEWPISFTMVFGSFIAGASAEGGGAVAFPVFTLLFDMSPYTARNFSFAIQSIGMTSASLLILGKKIPIDKAAIKYCGISGIVGLIVGAFLIADNIPPKEVKLFFVSLWLSFGLVMLFNTFKKERIVISRIKIEQRKDEIILILFGFIGGIISSIFGNGVDIFSFCLLTLYFRLSEKIATPTSVIIMTINTIVGFFIHVFIIKDFGHEVLGYWLVAAPVALLSAPLGAFFISFISRKNIAAFLISLIFIQFITAMIIIKPNNVQIMLCFLVFIVGGILFIVLNKYHKRIKVNNLTANRDMTKTCNDGF